MKCESCPAYRRTSYEYGEYECYAEVPESEQREYADGKWGCVHREKTIQKWIDRHDKVWEMTAEQALDFLKDPPPITNADRIRKMTDRELAMLICCQDYKSGDECFDTSCFDCTMEWLQQEASEN